MPCIFAVRVLLFAGCCLLLPIAISPDTNVQLSLHDHDVRKSFFIAMLRIRRCLLGKEEWNREDD